MQFSEHFGIECVNEVSIYMVCFLFFFLLKQYRENTEHRYQIIPSRLNLTPYFVVFVRSTHALFFQMLVFETLVNASLLG